jgi:TonB-linked SusC/RagA family outer membrane protein
LSSFEILIIGWYSDYAKRWSNNLFINLKYLSMKRITSILVFLAFCTLTVLSQDIQIKGTVINSDDGSVIPGVAVVIKGTTNGTTTNVDGVYTLTAPSDATLLFTFVGMETLEEQVNGRTQIDVAMTTEAIEVGEVVVTALGVTREKRSLGYAVQEVSGEEINQVKSDNFINTISGKVAGVNVKVNGNLGGSTNVVIRGSKSLYQSNQALFVIDGVPIDNSNSNNNGQIDGRSGFDYGNTASDVNPSDIESINVLKGAAATALYGARAANGVIMITTKKGSVTPGKKIGVNITSNVTVGIIDKSTFPTYQNKYGAGYGRYYYSGGDHPGLEQYADVDGDGQLDYTVPFYEDASFGEPFDPDLMVYQWDAFTKGSSNYMKKTPWVAGKNGPETFFNNSLTLSNTIAVSTGNEKSNYRLSYTNYDQSGIMPNGSLKRNNFLFNGSYSLLKNVKVSASAEYINTAGKARNGTGYNDNILTSFRQWYQVNVDIKQLKTLYDATGENVTWNRNAYDDPTPAYWDSPYWVQYENYETDGRDRLIGYTQLDWTVTDWMSIMGRYSLDTYSSLQEERRAIGSVSGEFGVGRPDITSGYSRFTRDYLETNMDVMANFNKDFGTDISLSGLLGMNIRRSQLDRFYNSTNGGISIEHIYAISGTKDPMRLPEEAFEREGVNGYFGSVSLEYKKMFFLDATYRQDISSTLPVENRSYGYPSVSGSFLFSEVVKASWLSMGKVRLNYAQVGSDAPWSVTEDSYKPIEAFNSNPIVSVDDTKNKPDLKPEKTNSIEAGLEMSILQNRLGFDLALYKSNTIDLITPLKVSFATGYQYKYLNAGEMENKGIELSLTGTPVRMIDFKWDVRLNWTMNRNQVISLAEGLDVLPINDGLQGGVTIVARVGEPYGAIQGTNWDIDPVTGKRIIRSNGYYQLTPTSDIVIGNINPDWNAGLTNAFSYKSLTFSFLIDWQQGGSIFSLDQWYGQGTGLYPESAGTNDLGNPVRDPVIGDAETGYDPASGGLVLDGVMEDGTTNIIRVEGSDYRVWGWARNPNAKFVYDASYVKLREVVLSYSLPRKLMEKTFIYGASVSFVGSNLWIIHKNLPYADPEAGQSSGNTQGWQSGVMPATRNFGLTLDLQF